MSYDEADVHRGFFDVHSIDFQIEPVIVTPHCDTLVAAIANSDFGVFAGGSAARKARATGP